MATPSSKCLNYQQKQGTLSPSVALFFEEGHLDRIRAQGTKLVSGPFFPQFSFLCFSFPLFNFPFFFLHQLIIVLLLSNGGLQLL